LTNLKKYWSQSKGRPTVIDNIDIIGKYWYGIVIANALKSTANNPGCLCRHKENSTDVRNFL